jgi:hypothetical protein
MQHYYAIICMILCKYAPRLGASSYAEYAKQYAEYAKNISKYAGYAIHTQASFNTMRYKGRDSASGIDRKLSIIRPGTTTIVAP